MESRITAAVGGFRLDKLAAASGGAHPLKNSGLRCSCYSAQRQSKKLQKNIIYVAPNHCQREKSSISTAIRDKEMERGKFAPK